MQPRIPDSFPSTKPSSTDELNKLLAKFDEQLATLAQIKEQTRILLEPVRYKKKGDFFSAFGCHNVGIVNTP